MPALPWSARASLPPTYACFVTVSQQALRRYRDVPAFLWHLRAVRRQWQEGQGLLGYTLAGRLRDRTFWTVSAWTDQDAARIPAAGETPGPALRASTSVSWFCLAEDLPIGWDEVHHRLRYAANVRPGAVLPASPACG